MEIKTLHILLTWHPKKMFQSMLVDFKKIVFGGLLDFDCLTREHLNHNIRPGPSRPKFFQEKMKPRII